MTIAQSRRALLLAGLLVVGITIDNRATIRAQSSKPLSFTSAQSEQGQAVYDEHCASCHGQYMDDGQCGPPLRSVDFRARWTSRSAEALFSYMSASMPPARPGSLGDASYTKLLAFVLQENGTLPSDQELPSDPD